MSVDSLQRKPKLNESIFYFDFLKILVVILISCVHHEFYAHQLIDSSSFLSYIAINGHTLVYLMFLMSGVLYFFTHHKKIQNQEIKFFDFISKKYVRFFFLPFITTSLTVFFFVAFNEPIGFVSKDPVDYIVSIVFFGRSIFGLPYINNGPLWFINVLMFVYIIAFLASKTPKKYAPYVFGVLTVAGIAMSRVAGIPFFNAAIGEGFFPFFLGVLLGYLFEFILDKKLLRIIIKIASLALIVSFVLIDIVFKVGKSEHYSLYTTLLLFVPLLIVLYDIPALNKAFSHKLFRKLGALSFLIYIWNWPAVQLLNIIFVNNFVTDRTVWWMLLITIVWHLALALLTLFLQEKICNFIANRKIKKSLEGAN